MIIFIITLPIFFLVLATQLESFFAKRAIAKYVKDSNYTYIENLYGHGNSKGLRVGYPSTPPGSLSVYLLKDIILITGTVRMFWMYNAQKRLLVLQHPNSKIDYQSVRIHKITSCKVFERRIRIYFSVHGLSNVEYTLGLNRDCSQEDVDLLTQWFTT